MTSSGLKRPLDFELPQHPATSFTSGPISIGNNKRRCTNFALPQSRIDNQIGGGGGAHNNSSPFRDSSSFLAPLSEDIATMIKDEIHRCHDHSNHYRNNTNNNNNNTSANNSNPNTNETPTLTIRQTQLICEKLIKDREQKLREEYDKILINKLAEQYDTFVKYTHDHIEKRYNESNSHQASYLS